MKNNHQILRACGERSRTIKQIFCRLSLSDSALTLRSSAFLFLFIAFLFSWQTILAHGGGELQISNAPVGEYQVSVWNNPPTARAGQSVHITVGVARRDNGEPVLDTAVAITIVNESGEPVAAAAATTEQSVNRLFYEADLEGVPAGTYEVQVQVTGSEGSGMLTFRLKVVQASVLPWLVGGVAVGGIVWLVLKFWRRGKQTAVPRHRFVD